MFYHFGLRRIESSINETTHPLFRLYPYTTRSGELGGSSVAKVKQEVLGKELC